MSDLELQRISHDFPTDEGHHAALHNISLSIIPGELTCIMGPSGGGKSTLLRIMAGLISARSGTVINRPTRLGFVFQSFGLWPWLTVEENIAYGLKMAGSSIEQQQQAAKRLIKQLELTGLAQRHPKELSGGQKQRVGLARALAIEPEILLLDEPFSALDAFTAAELRSEILKLWQASGLTLVMVTHSAEEAVQLADRIIVLSPRPGHVIKDLRNRLPRPRDLRSQSAFKLIDRLTALIKTN